MGCNALCYSAISLLEAVAERLELSFHYRLFSNQSARALELYPELLGKQIDFVNPLPTIRSKIKALLGLGGKTSVLAFEEAFESCNLFLELAGGDSYSDIYGLSRLQHIYAFHRLAIKAGKKLVFMPQTIGPFASQQARAIAATSLSYADCVFVRDPLSYNEAVAFTTKERVRPTIDMAFFMEYKPAEVNEDGPQRIGINPSGLLWNNGYSGKNEFGLKSDFKELITSICEVVRGENTQVELIGHDVQGPFYDLGDDYRVCKLLQSKCPQCRVAPFFYTPTEAKSYISGLNLLIGARMHCCIAAYSSGVPVFPLAYSRKFRGLFKDELQYPYGAELVAQDVRDAVGGLQTMLGSLSTIRAGMSLRVGKLRQYRDAFVGDLISCVFNGLR
jgi:polysaccharide pyruvyl transferase WcaK-like protein